ncbi:PIN domain-containing protein [Streptomyces rubiginosohelvolus]|uniref:PIN domain-containing protein n=1 Tax=Streptomyces rubiginosohelvolus TaxID=67362 RepID=UPI0034312A40
MQSVVLDTAVSSLTHKGKLTGSLATRLIGRIPVLPADEAVAATWGRLSAAGRKAGLPQPVNDMWIAACCLTHDLPLATLNLKDYAYFKDHHRLRILGEQ